MVDTGGEFFDTKSWQALQQCRDLEVLWIDSTTYQDGRACVVRNDHDTIRRVVDNQLENLELCMINPDRDVKSRYGKGVKDRLNG
mmetsp:Transcript_19978/g.30024  ORF Transcript_19978/g.30024 Transcript_19978/m.30024 type:complete len:85 (-) Transcript_19978:125-379(-)